MQLGVIFDMDGVLVDSYQPHFQSWRVTAQARGLDMTEQQFATTFGRTSREIILHFWPEHVKDADDVRQWDWEKEEAYRAYLREHFPAMDGAPELLQALDAAGFHLAVGSSGPPQNVQTIVECLPSANLFRATVSAADVSAGKPNPEVFLKASGKLGLAPRQCLVVEDAPAGVAAGKAAGMPVIAITGTVTRDKLAQANVIVDSLREITPHMVKSLIQNNATA